MNERTNENGVSVCCYEKMLREWAIRRCDQPTADVDASMRGGGKKAMMRTKKRRINESRAEQQQPRKKRNYINIQRRKGVHCME